MEFIFLSPTTTWVCPTNDNSLLYSHGNLSRPERASLCKHIGSLSYSMSGELVSEISILVPNIANPYFVSLRCR